MELRDREQGDRRLGCSSITDRWALGHVHDNRVERKRQTGNALVVSEVCIIGVLWERKESFYPG